MIIVSVINIIKIIIIIINIIIFYCYHHHDDHLHIDRLVQDCSISIADTLETLCIVLH